MEHTAFAFFTWRKVAAETPVRHRSRPAKPVSAKKKPWHQNDFLKGIGAGSGGTLAALGGAAFTGKMLKHLGPSGTEEAKGHAAQFMNEAAEHREAVLNHQFGS